MKKTLLFFFFAAASLLGLAQNTKTYTDQLVVTINETSSSPQDANVVISYLEDGTCNLSLEKFFLVNEEDIIPIGNINVKGITLEDGDGVKTFSTTQSILIEPGDENAENWLGPMLGEVPIVMTGKLTDEKLFCSIDIDMTKSLQQIIHVQFGTDHTDGINSAVADVQTNGKVYNLNGVCVGNNLNVLPKGLYIVNGKKVSKK
jgi:hypothetical protein